MYAVRTARLLSVGFRSSKQSKRFVAQALSTYAHNHNNQQQWSPIAMMLTSAAILTGVTVSSITQSTCEQYPEHEDDERERIRINSKLPLTRNFVADVVEVCSPAVVNIVSVGNGSFGGMVASAGSGFIISKDGYVVTNAHVVSTSGDGNVVVTLKDGRKKSGRVHSMDTQSDIAIVKIDDKFIDHPLPTIPFGISSKARAGEFVIAIGSPMQLQNSASLGIISATARHASELGLSNNRAEYIQTDAAINVGNSGGPLVNLDGEVIGINTMKVKNGDGISLAIPIDIAAVIINQLMQHKRVVRPYVGLRMANIIPVQEETDRSLSFFRNKKKSSQVPPMMNVDKMQVVVLDVVRGSPAYLAGVQTGDVVLNINGKEVGNVKDVLSEIGLDVGKTIDLTVRRNGDHLKLTFTTAPETARPTK